MLDGPCHWRHKNTERRAIQAKFFAVLSIIHKHVTLAVSADKKLGAEPVRMLTAHLTGRDTRGDEKTPWQKWQ